MGREEILKRIKKKESESGKKKKKKKVPKREVPRSEIEHLSDPTISGEKEVCGK